MSNSYLDLLEQWLCNIDTHSRVEDTPICEEAQIKKRKTESYTKQR